MSLGLLTLTGCVGMDDMPVARPPVRMTGNPVVDGNAQLAAAPERDRVLWEYRVAAAALREGKYDEARAKLDDAIRRMGGVISGPDYAARRARSLFTAENQKTFIGEPYERVMAFYYRGLLYWRDGQPDNARACFRSAQFIDSDAESASYRSDYVLLDYLDGLVSTKLGADGRDAFARAQKLSKSPLPPYDPQANVLCFVEFGHGPRKVATGQYGEQLRFRVEPSRVRSAALSLVDENVHFLPWDNLDYQAITRGGRVMDYILGNKAVFKGTADAVGDLALAGAAVAADNIYKEKPRTDSKPDAKKDDKHDDQPEYEKSEGAQDTAIALGVIGVFAKLASAAAQPQADTRTWDNLPQYLSFSALRLPAGAHPAMLQFFDAQGHVVDSLTRRLTIDVGDPARDTVVILSELNR
jgi:hypothetical protein